MKKMNVVLFTDHNRFPEHEDLMRGVAAAIEECGHNLMLVPMLLNASKENLSVSYICQMIVQLKRMNIDGYILPVDCLKHVANFEEVYQFLLKQLDHRKILCIGEDVGDLACIKKSDEGLKDLLKHLLEEHLYRHFGILSGMGISREMKRNEELCKKKIDKYDGSYVVKHCSMQDDVKAIVKELLENNPKMDCLITLSDQFAPFAYEAIRELGLKVGKDIAVTGYGDLSLSRLLDPPLTTVCVDYYRMGYYAAVELINILQGASQKYMVFPTTFVRRASTGDDLLLEDWKMLELTSKKPLPVEKITDYIYTSSVASEHHELYDLIHRLVSIANKILKGEHAKNGEKLICEITNYADCNYFSYTKFDEKLKNFYHYLNQVYNKKRLFREYIKYTNQFKRIMNQRALIQEEANLTIQEGAFKLVSLTAFHETDQEAAYKEMLNCIETFGFDYASFYYLDEPFPIKDYESHELFLKATIKHDLVDIYDFEKVDAQTMLVPFEKDVHTCVLCGLFAGFQILGFMLVECPVDRVEHVCLTAENLGLATKYLNLFSKNKMRMTLIEQYNEALQYEADYDELTGLLNRRGFIRKSYELFSVYEGMHAYLYYIDLDRLKKINDTYGHLEGDFAINKVANILRDSFRETDLVARMGGDEFAALAIMPQNDEDVNGKRFKHAYETFNETHVKDYRISASIAYIEFEIHTGLRMEDLFNSADSLLYKAKEINHQKLD